MMSALDVENAASEKQFWQSTVLHKAESGAATVRSVTAVLDRIIPLHAASHADVNNYTVEIPMRYAECFAILTDGRRVAFRDARKFLAWSGWEAERSYLFRNKGLLVEIKTNPDLYAVRDVPGKVYDIVVRQLMPGELVTADKAEIGNNDVRKFIAPDGNQILMSGRQRRTLRDMEACWYLV
jgi:hypothetical protein